MSWDSYVENLCATGDVKQGAVVGSDGSVWAASPGFTVDGNWTNLANWSADSSAFQSEGIKVGSEKFMYLKRDDETAELYGKKGSASVSIARGATFFILGTSPDKPLPQIRGEVCRVRDYLATTLSS